MTRPERHPNHRQLDAVRDHLHAIVDRAISAWPTIDRQAREMTRGFAGGGTGASTSGDADPTMRAALFDGVDPAQRAEEWLAHLREFMSHAKNLDNELASLSSVDPSSIERGRINTVDICAECGDPVINGKRLDNVLYHNGGNDPPCFSRARNRIRGRRGNGGYSTGECGSGAA